MKRSGSTAAAIPRARRRLVVRALVGGALLLGCEDVVVDPIDVDHVQIAPDSAQLVVGDSIRLEATPYSRDGKPLSGVPVTWASRDTLVVVVNGSGQATGRGPGTTTITATAGAESGSADVVVLRPAILALDLDTVRFTTVWNEGDPTPVRVAVSSTGDVQVNDLTATITYTSDASDWLEAALESGEPPTTLVVTPHVAGLPFGTHRAMVHLHSDRAGNAPLDLPVELAFRQGVPAAPSELRTTAVSDTTVELAWTDNSGNESEFRLERRAPGETAFRNRATLGTGIALYTDGAVAADGVYQYRVRACSPDGCSDFSNEATATTPPIVPADPAARPISPTAIEVSWTDRSQTETEVRIERQEAGGAFVAVGTVEADVTRFSDSDLRSATAYGYRLRGCNTGGCSAYSGIATATTPDLPVPVAPADLSATTQSATRIRLTWLDRSDDEDEFQIERQAPGEAGPTLLATVGAGTTAYDDTNVTGDATYTYRVRACAAGGCSAFTATARASTPPTAPSGLMATAIADTRIDLAWTDASATETAFRITRAIGTGTAVLVATTGTDVTAYVDDDLAPTTTYTYRVQACNSGGCSATTDAVSATTPATPPPAAPGALAATLREDGTGADLTWTDNSAEETSFTIQRRIDDGAFSDLATLPANTTGYTNLGLAEDHWFAYRVLACGRGGCSPPSNTAAVLTRPRTPGAVTATATAPTSVRVAWTDASATESDFRVQRRTGTGTFAEVGVATAGASEFTDGGVESGTAYGYRLVACNASGCSNPSGEATAATPLVAPTGLAAVGATETTMDVSWTDNSANETEFRLERAGAGSGFSQIATPAAGETRYTDTALRPGVPYTYRIRACNAAACSDYSAQATGTTIVSAPPAAPAELSATLIGESDRVDLTWADRSSNEARFEVERSVDGGSFLLLTTVAADGSDVSDAAIDRDHRYDYRVRACNSAGCSAYSGEDGVATVPWAPSALAATAAGRDVTVTWSDNSVSEDGFRVERSESGGAFKVATTAAAGTTSWLDKGRPEDTQLAYRVSACNSGGCSEADGPVMVVTVPRPASKLNATAVSSSRIELRWNDNSDTETDVRVERRKDGRGDFILIVTLPGNAINYSDTGLDRLTKYEYRIVVCNAAGCADASNKDDATTLLLGLSEPATGPAGSRTARVADRPRR